MTEKDMALGGTSDAEDDFGEGEEEIAHRRDAVLKRMLNTPPKPHKPSGKKGASKAASKPRRKKERA